MGTRAADVAASVTGPSFAVEAPGIASREVAARENALLLHPELAGRASAMEAHEGMAWTETWEWCCMPGIPAISAQQAVGHGLSEQERRVQNVEARSGWQASMAIAERSTN
jgi:hypothetical protein